MSFNQNPYPSASNLIGNVDVPLNINPAVRSSLRRLDPDGFSNSPYYANAAGKVLRINYTIEVASVVTPASKDITLSSVSLAQIITDINAADPSNLGAVDQDGFLVVRNLNSGKTHFLSIAPYTTNLTIDAAPVVGFDTAPLPSSTSYAGEIAATPGSRTQQNPQSTTLIAKDETLSSTSINRSLVSILQMVENIRAVVYRDIVVYRDVPLTFSNHPITSSKRIAWINHPEIRLFYPAVSNDSFTVINLDQYFRVIDSNRNTVVGTAANYPTTRVIQLYYAADTTPLVDGFFIGTWGIPDGNTLISTLTPNIDKQPATAITSIKGNIIECDAATFQTLQVFPGDPVQLTAAVLQPFDHSGWFVVDAVIDETHIVVRPMSDGEEPPTNLNRPWILNPDAGGTLRVALGHFIPATNIYIEVDDVTATSLIIRMPIGVSFREATFEQLGNTFGGLLDQLSQLLYNHITATANAHPATAITGFTTAASWQNGSHLTGATVAAMIENLISALGSHVASGSALVGSAEIDIAGLPPNTLAVGSVRDQAIQLLTDLQTHVNDAAAHAGGGATYTGSGPWADGTSVPGGLTVIDAITRIVSDLASEANPLNGANKIGIKNRTSWLGSRPNPGSVSVFTAIDKIITDLGDATVGDDGAERVAAGPTVDLAVGSVRSQLDALAVGWGKLIRAQSWSATQTLNGTAVDTNAAIVTSYVPTLRKLLWQAALEGGLIFLRMYAGQNDVGVGFELTINARWDGVSWNKDSTGEGTRLALVRTGMYLQQRLSGDSSVWGDDLTHWHAPLYLAAENPADNTVGMGPSVTPANVVRAHGCFVITTGTLTSANGFNYTAATGALFSIVITFVTPLANANYTPFVWLPNSGTNDAYTIAEHLKTASSYSFNVLHLSNSGGAPTILQPASSIIEINFMIMGQ